MWLQFEENHMCGLQFDGKDKCVLLCYNEDTPVLIVELMSYALQQQILMCGFSSSQNHMCGFSSYIFILEWTRGYGYMYSTVCKPGDSVSCTMTIQSTRLPSAVCTQLTVHTSSQ